MTAPRRPRSAWVLGRLDAVDGGKGPERRPALAQVGGEEAVVRRFRALARRVLEQRPELLLERGDPFEQAGSITFGPEGVPGCEDAAGDREASRAEVLLGSEPLAVGGEVAHEVGRAELAPFGVEVVVGPAAVGAGDAGEVLAEQRPDLALVPVSGDSEDRCAGGERAPERALAAAQAPAGLVDVDGRRGADLKAKLAKGRHRRTESHDALRSRDCEKRRFKPVLDSRLVRNRRRVARCALWQLSRTATRDLQPTPRAASSSYTRPREYQIPSGLATRILKVAPAKA
jgi:hypothetical protein